MRGDYYPPHHISGLRNFLTVKQAFSVITLWTWDNKHGIKVGAVRFWLSMLGMTPITDTISGITVILFICHCCLISNNSWHLHCFSCNCGLMESLCQQMQLPYLFRQSVLYLANWNEQSCLLKSTFQTEIVVFQDDLWLICIIWRIWFLKKILFHKFLMENFGDLVCRYLYVFWATPISWGSASSLICHVCHLKFFVNFS